MRRGDSFREIGRRYGMSHEGARQTVMTQGGRFIDEVDLVLMVAAQYEQMGRADEAEYPALVLPHQAQEDWQLAISLRQYTCRTTDGRCPSRCPSPRRGP